jgi:hypothetical protein
MPIPNCYANPGESGSVTNSSITILNTPADSC